MLPCRRRKHASGSVTSAWLSETGVPFFGDKSRFIQARYRDLHNADHEVGDVRSGVNKPGELGHDNEGGFESTDSKESSQKSNFLVEILWFRSLFRLCRGRRLGLLRGRRR
jgi:hypothetical protein